jgi:hypothetical protein
MKHNSFFKKIIFITLFFPFLTHSQVTIDFNDIGYTDNQNITKTVNIAGFRFTINSPNNDQIQYDTSQNPSGSPALFDNNSDVGDITEWKIEKIDNSKFQLSSIYLQDWNKGGSKSGTITAYRNGAIIGSAATITFNGTTTLSSNPDFNNIDEIRINAVDINFFLDDLIYIVSNTWNGSTDNNWDTASNWSTNSVPVSETSVTIPAGLTHYPTATSAINVNSITIASGASFIPGGTVTGAVTYKRNVPTTDWFLLAASSSGETFEDLISQHTFATGESNPTNIGIASFSNNTGAPWIYKTSQSTGAMVSGLGYSMKLAAPGEISITGTAHTANVNLPISTGTRNNFNLLGNPYYAYLNSANLILENSELLTEETIWLWNGISYVTHNAANPMELDPGQGFFVEASISADFTFPQENQLHQSSVFPVRQEPVANFELSIEDGNDKSATKVFYVEGKTASFDNGYDSKMFGDAAYDFALFTELVTDNEGKKLAIQTLPNTDLETMIIPVGIIAEAGKEITFSINITNFPSGKNVYLEDRVNNTFTNLSEENYNITLDVASKGIGQFYIHTRSQALNVQDSLLKNISIYKTTNNTLRITGLQSENAVVKVFNMLGKQMMTKAFKTNGVKEIWLPRLTSGIYLVQLQSDKGRLNKKIILE